MSFNQTRDLLEWARKFHRRLALIYGNMLENAANEETRELLNTLLEHEEVLEKRLTEYEGTVSANILDTFFKYMVKEHMDCISAYNVPETVTSHDVIEATRHFDNCLSDFYKEMAAKAMSEQVRDVLLNLMEMELIEQMSLSKQSLELAIA